MNDFNIVIKDDDILFGDDPLFVDTVFYIDYNGQCFPDNQWTDLTNSVLSMWTITLLDNLHMGNTKFVLPFMDGPFRLDVIKEQDSLHINCVNSRNNEFVVFTMHCKYYIFLKAICDAVKLLNYIVHKALKEGKCDNEVCQWLSKDFRFLIKKLDNTISNSTTT